MQTLLTLALLASTTGEASARETLSLVAEPETVVLGEDDTITLTLRVPEDTDPSQLIFRSTVGSLGPLKSMGAGTYRAQLTRPTQGYPQYGVITAAFFRGDEPLIAQVIVSYLAKIQLKGRSEPGSRMRVVLGGRESPEVEVDDDGTFDLPIEVRPGERWATGIARDRLGNRSTSTIDLFLPELPRTHAFVHPQPQVVGTPGWLFVTTVSNAGAPEKRGVPPVTSKRGTLGSLDALAPGVYVGRYQPPTKTSPSTDTVSVEAASPIIVALAPSRLERLECLGGRVPWDQELKGTIRGYDRFSNPVPLASVEVPGGSFDGARSFALPPPNQESTMKVSLEGRDHSGHPARCAVTLSWHRPLPLTLEIRWLDAQAVEIKSSDQGQALERLRVRATDAAVTRRQRFGDTLRVEFDRVSASTKVIARDPNTGTSVWIAAP